MLPNDVVCHLFCLLAAMDPPTSVSTESFYPLDASSKPGSLGWIKLTHVSRDWRRVGLNISALWANIICVFPPAFDTILPRTKSALLNLNLDHGEDLDYIWDSHKILDILPRVQHLQDTRGYTLMYERFRSSLSGNWISVLEGRTLSSLESLTLWHYNAPAETTHIHNETFVAPVLTTLAVDFLFPFIAPQLKALSITEHISHWRQLLDAVAACPLLETLEAETLEEPRFGEWAHMAGGLTKDFFVDEVNFKGVPAPVARLPRLRLFEVTGRWGSDSDAFLLQLEIPSGCVVIKGGITDSNSDDEDGWW